MGREQHFIFMFQCDVCSLGCIDYSEHKETCIDSDGGPSVFDAVVTGSRITGKRKYGEGKKKKFEGSRYNL